MSSLVRVQVDFSHYSDAPVAMAVDLVNTRDTVTGIDSLADPADVSAFLLHCGEDFCPPEWDAAEKDLHEVRALRARLREVFTAKDAATAAAVVNSVLVDVGANPRVSVHDDVPPHLHFEPDTHSPARWLGAVTAMGLAVALIEGGLDRLGVCGSGTCAKVFIDTSRNRSRHHCSDTCTSRENVAAYRRRQREDA